MNPLANVADFIPLQTIEGPETGKLLVVTWGGTYGACATAVKHRIAEGKSVAHCHLRYLHPFPRNLGEILSRYETILVPEWNLGQLRLLLRAEYLINAVGLNKIQGKPFNVAEVEAAIDQYLS